MVYTLQFQYSGHRFNPWVRNKIPHAMWCGQNIKKKKSWGFSYLSRLKKLPYIECLKQQTFISYSSGSCKSQIRVPAWLGSGESPRLSCRLLIATANFSLCPHTEEKSKLALWFSVLLPTYLPLKGLPFKYDNTEN